MRISQRQLLTTNIRKKFFSFKRKGFTLLEVIVSIAIFLIIGSCAVKVLTLSIVDFKGIAEDTKEEFYVDEAYRFIEQECKMDTKTVEVIGNKIKLERFSFDNPSRHPIDYIEKSGSNLLIRYTAYGLNLGTNVILRNIQDFSISRDNNLLYIKIKKDSERCYELCIGFSNLK
jgi:prepilin-type N-terminal cleavage/methylation domain